MSVFGAEKIITEKIAETELVLCQDLVQVKMRKTSF